MAFYEEVRGMCLEIVEDCLGSSDGEAKCVYAYCKSVIGVVEKRIQAL